MLKDIQGKGIVNSAQVGQHRSDFYKIVQEKNSELGKVGNEWFININRTFRS